MWMVTKFNTRDISTGMHMDAQHNRAQACRAHENPGRSFESQHAPQKAVTCLAQDCLVQDPQLGLDSIPLPCTI